MSLIPMLQVIPVRSLSADKTDFQTKRATRAVAVPVKPSRKENGSNRTIDCDKSLGNIGKLPSLTTNYPAGKTSLTTENVGVSLDGKLKPALEISDRPKYPINQRTPTKKQHGLMENTRTLKLETKLCTQNKKSHEAPRTRDMKRNIHYRNLGHSEAGKDLKEILFPGLYGPSSVPSTPSVQWYPQYSGSFNNANNFPHSCLRITPPPLLPAGVVEAFAGSSFHRSPAPSTLPKPSFKKSPKSALKREAPPPPSTPFEQVIANKFESNTRPITNSLEQDLKRLLNVNHN